MDKTYGVAQELATSFNRDSKATYNNWNGESVTADSDVARIEYENGLVKGILIEDDDLRLKLTDTYYDSADFDDEIINGTFDNGTTGWTVPTTAQVTTGDNRLESNRNGEIDEDLASFYQIFSTPVGQKYRVTFNLISVTLGDFIAEGSTANYNTIHNSIYTNTPGQHSFEFTATTTSSRISIRPENFSGVMIVDNVSVVPLNNFGTSGSILVKGKHSLGLGQRSAAGIQGIFSLKDSGTSGTDTINAYIDNDSLVYEIVSGGSSILDQDLTTSLDSAFSMLVTYETGSQKAFLNGTKVADLSVTSALPSTSIDTLQIGGIFAGSTLKGFNGNISELKFWPRVLSDSEGLSFSSL